MNKDNVKTIAMLFAGLSVGISLIELFVPMIRFEFIGTYSENIIDYWEWFINVFTKREIGELLLRDGLADMPLGPIVFYLIAFLSVMTFPASILTLIISIIVCYIPKSSIYEKYYYVESEIRTGYVIHSIVFVLLSAVLFFWFNEIGVKPFTTMMFIPFLLDTIIFIVWCTFYSQNKELFVLDNCGDVVVVNLKAELKKCDTLIKYKEFYDNDIITEEEYISKRDELYDFDSEEYFVTISRKIKDRDRTEIIQKYKQLQNKGIISEEVFLKIKSIIL